MDSGLSTSSNQHQYQKIAQWSRSIQRKFLRKSAKNNPKAVATGFTQLSPQFNLYSCYLPQQSYHQELPSQNRKFLTPNLVTNISHLSSPLPPLLSANNIQAVSGIRFNPSKLSTGRFTELLIREGHGNKRSSSFIQAERVLIAKLGTVAMISPNKLDMSNSLHHQPKRIQPSATDMSLNQQSNSVPSTPHQHLRKFSFESREPSPSGTNNHSPRSAYSESNITFSSAKSVPRHGGCRFETALANIKRRMPYSIGSEKLEKLNSSSIKNKLSLDEEKTLSTDIKDLYQRLLPSPECELRRAQLVCKLEKLFNDKWPGHNILVHVFGSSGNSLYTDHSDVDLCITTDKREMEGVCIIADLLAKNGMQKVICVSTAKVPIVKIWDPELCLACDMNVNNTLALENTRMIKTYVQIDERVRPLAMIIKHWTKRRIVNDAAFGGTLSSYTWICMIINFLQSRKPPILPALHQRTHIKTSHKGAESAFSDDIEALRNFGYKNKETLGELLFSFFRFYAHEFDYDSLVISVRHGKQISKVEKGWHLTNNNRLCVEEPFNVSRNLGNTADDTSFRGLHIELRRAFDLISKAKLQECCEQWFFPPEEERKIREPAIKAKVVLRSASTSRGGRGGTQRLNHRHSSQQYRHSNNNNNNNNNNRRASSAAFEGNPFLPGHPQHSMVSQENWQQRQAQAQAQLHNDLYTTYSALQAHENNLRFQLYAHGLQAQAYAQSQATSTQSSNSRIIKPVASEQSRSTAFDQTPSLASAPMRPDLFYYPTHCHGTSIYKYPNSNTNPSSPSLGPIMTEMRRSTHRSTITSIPGQHSESSNSSTLRSHSQPATRSGLEEVLPGSETFTSGLDFNQKYPRQSNSISIPNFIADDNLDSLLITSNPPENPMPMKYVGYYVQEKFPSPTQRDIAIPMKVPTFGDMGQPKRRHSTDQIAKSVQESLRHSSRSPSPLGHNRFNSMGQDFQSVPGGNPRAGSPYRSSITSSVVSCPNRVPFSIQNWQAQVNDASISDELASDLSTKSVDSNSYISYTANDFLRDSETLEQTNAKEICNYYTNEHPLIVNGSTVINVKNVNINGSTTSKMFPKSSQNTRPSAEFPNGYYQLPTHTRKKSITSSNQNSIISSKDSGHDISKDDLSNLSPVYETLNSPTGNQIKDSCSDRKSKNEVSRLGERKTASLNLGQLPQGNWQQVPRSKKKNTPNSQKSSANGSGQCEKLPKNASDRKGG